MNYKNKKIIAVIPARGGSKGVPKKNIKPLLGKPLIEWTIDQIKDSKYIDEVYVSTDDSEISSISKSVGLKVIKRPEKISGDEASTESALIHTSNQLNNSYDIMLLFQCTSPMRYSYQIDEAIEKFFEEDADSLLTGYRNDSFFWDNEGNPLNYDPDNRPRRQDKEWEFVENGSFYIFKKNILLNKKNRLGGKISQYLMPKWMSFEIDEPLDLELVKFMMKQKYIKQEYNKRLKEKIKKLKLILFDVDGIFTDGSVYLNEKKEEMLKFSRIDGKGIELLRKRGYKIGVISSEDSDIVRERMKKLKVDDIYLGIKDKLTIYEKLKNKYELKDEEVCFCGDDVQDIPVLKKAGLGCCPKNAQDNVKNICDYRSEKTGGEGFVRNVSEVIIE